MIQRSLVSVILTGCTIEGSTSGNKGEDNLIYNINLVNGTWTVEQQTEKELEKVIIFSFKYLTSLNSANSSHYQLVNVVKI